MKTVAAEVGGVAAGMAIKLGTASTAAKSVVARRGLGRRRHIEVWNYGFKKRYAKAMSYLSRSWVRRTLRT